MRRIYGDDPARIVAGIEVTETCWLWLRARTTGGYAETRIAGKTVYVHRFMYQLAKGPIPPGRQLDHLCRVRHCVNPDHLEAVEPIENWRRGESPTRTNSLKTHCIHGHSLADAYRYGRGRDCRTCRLYGRRPLVEVS